VPHYRPPIDTDLRRRSRRRNRLQTVLLLGGMIFLFAACGWTLGGLGGLIWLASMGALALIFGSQMSPQLILSLFQAEPLSKREFADIYEVVRILSARAGLSPPPLYFIPSPTLNAMTVGRGDNVALAITGGLLRTLTPMELAGVLAHEISHIANGDMRVMALADIVTRMTRIMSIVGLLMLLVNLPLILTETGSIPWLLVILLIAAPVLGTLLQLALSRAREFDADLDAVRLTGNPAALASALQKMERQAGRLWEEIFLPGRRSPDPSVLRTHPLTEDRVARLMALEVEQAPPLPTPQDPGGYHGSVPQVPRRPRFRRGGFWY
jgi:heat shock protein HtpX